MQISPRRRCQFSDVRLRNHGFLLTDAGWLLSPAYDVNPNEYGKGLHLNISDKDNSLSLDLALKVAEYFRLDNDKANQIIKLVKNTVANWEEIAPKYKIPNAE
ncbi:MAG TPA: HipA domain-containing protein [Chitinophagaceae bacterium]|nr:HipA domain-containing protein [Chitinophagaceae bacterium]